MLRLFLILLACFSIRAQAQTATVAVAANMKPAFEEIYQNFKQSHPESVRIVYGSSGNLASQIRQGAPFDLFIAADEVYPLRLYQEGKTLDQGIVYATGHLVLLLNGQGGFESSNPPDQIEAWLKGAHKIAIANPDLAPYGAAAVQYLKTRDYWDLVKAKLVFGENISIATMYVSSGAVDAGFTSLSLAKSLSVTKTTRYITLDGVGALIGQRMVLIKGAPKVVTSLYSYMQGPAAQSILTKYGYSIPQ
ncbi:molybdate ABC transporter substrate-binding protein [Polynucleobacter sp. Latsch14-2]|uniref:molybdate ABC transporter substrate-binding protein n=1 Tax=Polynucleobacter sp. Latsch14-2 TaxID=2576920 RepID=UPI0021020D0D|nr:molybdate ABC transporter substrate-binding protein [Polynucleobacter sp. Latsch14-2]